MAVTTLHYADFNESKGRLFLYFINEQGLKVHNIFINMNLHKMNGIWDRKMHVFHYEFLSNYEILSIETGNSCYTYIRYANE